MGQHHASKLMKQTKDPEIWISELEILRSRLKEMGTDIDEEFLILHILNNLQSNYDNVVENLEERVDSVLNPLGLEDVHQKLSEKYEKMKLHKKLKDNSENDKEQALFSMKCKGCCNKYDKFGHKAKDCCLKEENTNNNRKKKFNRKCHYCNKVGHEEANCWAKHGKPADNENTAEMRFHEESSNNNNDIVLISMEDIQEYDFAVVSFTDPEDNEEKKTKKEKENETQESEIKDDVEIIPGVPASMVQPFNKAEWTP